MLMFHVFEFTLGLCNSDPQNKLPCSFFGTTWKMQSQSELRHFKYKFPFFIKIVCLTFSLNIFMFNHFFTLLITSAYLYLQKIPLTGCATRLNCCVFWPAKACKRILHGRKSWKKYFLASCALKTHVTLV